MNSLHIYIYKNQEGVKRVGNLIKEAMSGNDCEEYFDGYQHLLTYENLSISYSDFYIRFFDFDSSHVADFSSIVEKMSLSLNAESIMYSTSSGKDKYLKLKNYKPSVFARIKHALNEFLKY